MRAAATEEFTAGLPVRVGEIGRELKKLWDANGGAMTRASLINLAVYSETPGSLAKNTELISKITQNHACRAIVVEADCTAENASVEAWISAHCRISRAGSKQICSEQLSFQLKAGAAALLPSIVFSQLDSDLPFYLWWQGEFHDPMDPQLWAWVDRLIYDSHAWSDFTAQMERVETAQAEARQRVVLCDLNWTRLVQFRLAIAQFFDHPCTHEYFEKIERVEIDFHPGFRSTAVLLVGWLAAQLQWRELRQSGKLSLTFVDAAGNRIAAALKEVNGQPISRCALHCGKLEFRVTHEPAEDLLHVWSAADGGNRLDELMPAGSDDPVALVNEELMRGGPHRVYLRALNCVRELL